MEQNFWNIRSVLASRACMQRNKNIITSKKKCIKTFCSGLRSFFKDNFAFGLFDLPFRKYVTLNSIITFFPRTVFSFSDNNVVS